jgi:hypothetical protein
MSAAFRVLLTGSRTWTDRAALERALDRQRAEHPDMVLVHGACPEGADQIGAEWAARNHVRQEPHPAEWRQGGQLDRAAGFRRNTEMAASGPDVCISANKGNSSGTAQCTAGAGRYGVPIQPVAGREAGGQRQRASDRIRPGPRCGYPDPDRCDKEARDHQAHHVGELRPWGHHDTQCQVPSEDPAQYPECSWIAGHEPEGDHSYQSRIGTPQRQAAEAQGREAGQ